MASTYTKDTLREMFRSAFDMTGWYSFVRDFFHATELKLTPERFSTAHSTEEGYYIGSIDTSDYFRIGLFCYSINQGSVANRRVGLRNLVRSFINPRWGAFDAALVVFYSHDHWRLSFICDIKEESTSPKRYTYVFGSRELLYRTPIERLLNLQKKGISFENLKTAFSVEALSDEFFDRYREQYADFIQYVTGKRFVKSGSKWVEKDMGNPSPALMRAFGNDEKKIRDYIKKMMGRITFLHFLQRKGWMNGDLNYMQNLFERSRYKDDYLDSVLEPLFFGILNTKPSERESLFDYYSWDKTLLMEWKDIPYLNGGLFERDEDDEPESVFPAEYFRRLFQFFSEYNFTIDENDPNDAEVGVDPEMLGKIFENLLEDNKDKGAFYTPKEIVRYMCQESLIAYLETNTKVAKDKIRAFVLSPEEAVSDIPESKKSKLLTTLEEVKICDPAIGSGAFPMGLLNALLRCREALSGDCYDRSELKKSIIQNNIYGVDIEKGAVDIARLRFWLSIVVDEETPSPLPNLDYKIMQGNSLIESFMGIDLSKLTYEKEHKKDKGEISLFDNEKNRLQKTVSNLLKVYYSCFDHNRKVKLQREISETINRQLEACFVDGAILEKLKGINLAENNQFFLWHTWFSDVFSREDGRSGFDIVIGNPPYIGEKGHKEIFQPVKKDVHLGKYYLGKMDYFYFFFHLSFNMLSANGVGIFITTNYYITALGAKKLRADIKERMSIMTLFNLGELRLFENAPGQHNMISLFSKVNDYGKCNIVDVHKKGTLNPLMFAQIINHKDNDTIYSEISQTDMFDGEEKYIRLQNNSTDIFISSLLNKIKLDNLTLGEIAEVNAGIMGGCDSITNHNIKYASVKYIQDNDIQKGDGVFVLDSNYSRDRDKIQRVEDSLFLKAFYKNSDINRYSTNEETTKKIIFSSLQTQLKEQQIIKSCLSLYKPILIKIREINNEKKDCWFQLRRGTAHPNIFLGPKIVCPQRSKSNTFGYNECDWFASADVYYITNPNKEYHIKYILGLLNSKLYYVWLYYKGKRKGETLELYQKPLSEIPIKKATVDIQNSIVEIIDIIIDLKKIDANHDISKLESKIDDIVYSIYGLTDEEIQYVEKSF